MIREEIIRDRFQDRILTVLMEWFPTQNIRKDGQSVYASYIISKREMMYMQTPLNTFQREKFDELWDKLYDKVLAEFNCKGRDKYESQGTGQETGTVKAREV